MEWHATESTFNHRLLAGMDQILTELEQGRIPAFTFDGQTDQEACPGGQTQHRSLVCVAG
jgi:hypothetical protein